MHSIHYIQLGNLNTKVFVYIYPVVQYKVLTSIFIDLTNPSMSIMDGPTMIKSFKYVKNIMTFTMYKHGSISEGLNPWSTRNLFSFVYQL